MYGFVAQPRVVGIMCLLMARLQKEHKCAFVRKLIMLRICAFWILLELRLCTDKRDITLDFTQIFKKMRLFIVQAPVTDRLPWTVFLDVQKHYGQMVKWSCIGIVVWCGIDDMAQNFVICHLQLKGNNLHRLTKSKSDAICCPKNNLFPSSLVIHSRLPRGEAWRLSWN